MADLILVATTVAFFIICAAYVQWCDRIIGPDDFGSGPEVDGETAATAGTELEEVTA